MALTKVTTGGITDATIATADIAADAVTGAKIADDAVGAEHIEQLDADLSFADSAKAKFGAGNDLEIHHTSNDNIINSATTNLYIQRNGTTSLTFDGNGDLNIPDSKVLGLGSGADLQLYHNGSDSYVKNTGGDLYIRDTNGNIYIQPKTDENAIKCTADGSVELYHDNSKVCETMANGIKLTDTELTEATDNFSINIQSGNNDFYVKSGGTTFAAFKGSAKDLQLTSGNLVIGTAGKGIDFSATSDVGGMSNELLDDYEEGTWTPHIDGWDTYTPYSGSSYHYNWYVKVGKLVHIGWKLYIQNLTTVSSDAHIRMTGVPFAHDSSGAGPIGHMRFDIPEFGMSGYPLVYLGGGGTTIYMYKHVNGGNNLVAMNAAANRSNVWCMGTATYATS